MISRLSGAVLRAMLVVLLVATPSLLLPGIGADGQQIVALVAIFGAALTIFEYASAYPGLVEFRDAETGKMQLVDSSSTAFHRMYERENLRRNDQIAQVFRSISVDRISIETNRPYIHDLVKFFHMRHRRA